MKSKLLVSTFSLSLFLMGTGVFAADMPEKSVDHVARVQRKIPTLKELALEQVKRSHVDPFLDNPEDEATRTRLKGLCGAPKEVIKSVLEVMTPEKRGQLLGTLANSSPEEFETMLPLLRAIFSKVEEENLQEKNFLSDTRIFMDATPEGRFVMKHMALGSTGIDLTEFLKADRLAQLLEDCSAVRASIDFENLLNEEWMLDKVRELKITEISFFQSHRARKIEELFQKSWHDELHTLNLSGHNIDVMEAAALAAIPHLAGIKTLNCSYNPIGDKGLAALAKSPLFARLKTLNLKECHFGNIGLTVLVESPLPAVLTLLAGLTTLDCSHNPIGDEGANELAKSYQLAELKTLNLIRCNIGDDGLAALAKSPLLAGLNTLNLSVNKIGSDGLAALAKSPLLARLKALNLSDNKIGDDGLTVLAESPLHARLKALNLSENNIGDRGLAALAKSPLFAGLNTLNLSYNQIGSAGLAVLAKSPFLVGLEELNLQNNRISNKGVAVLAESPLLAGLKALNLSVNFIGNDGLAVLAKSHHLAGLNTLELIEFERRPEGEAALRESPFLQDCEIILD